jgi:hypothetical protein
VGRGNEIDVVAPFFLQFQDVRCQLLLFYLFAFAEPAEFIILAIEASQIAITEKYGS